MSNRSKKSSTTSSTTYITKTSTPVGTSTKNTPGSVNRPSSPTFLSRLQEKNELAGLNDRLAVFMERVRMLEVENSRLASAVSSESQSVTKETTKVKDMYENELQNLRTLLDEISKDKARVQLENSRMKKECAEWMEKYHSKDSELLISENKVLSLGSQLLDVQARLSDALNKSRHWEEHYNKLKKDIEALNREMALLRSKLEEETIAKVDMENKMLSVEEDATFKAKVHQEELSEMFGHSKVEMEEVDRGLQGEYESSLHDTFMLIRDENAESIYKMRQETETVFENKYKELRETLSKKEGASEKMLSEMRSMKMRAEQQMNEVGSLKKLINTYEGKIEGLESALEAEKDSHMATTQALNAQIMALKKTIEEQMMEYKDLMDTKIKLDNEIAAYRKLIEGVENRQKATSVVRYSSPAKLDSTRKRRRMDVSEEASSFTSTEALLGRDVGKATNGVLSTHFKVNKSSTDIVQFDEVCSEGKFVRLSNTSEDKEFALGGLQLRLTAGEHESTYKFHRTLLLKPASTVTVWSADSEKTHQPPKDLLMKGQSWKLGDDNSCVLVDQKGEQVAGYEMKKSQVESQQSSFAAAYDDADSASSSKASGKGWLSFLGMIL